MIGPGVAGGDQSRVLPLSPPSSPPSLPPPSQARLRMKHAEIMVRGGPSEACPLIGSRRGPLHQGQALRLLDRACLRDMQAQMKEQLWGEGEEGQARPTYGEGRGLWGEGEEGGRRGPHTVRREGAVERGLRGEGEEGEARPTYGEEGRRGRRGPHTVREGEGARMMEERVAMVMHPLSRQWSTPLPPPPLSCAGRRAGHLPLRRFHLPRPLRRRLPRRTPRRLRHSRHPCLLRLLHRRRRLGILRPHLGRRLARLLVLLPLLLPAPCCSPPHLSSDQALGAVELTGRRGCRCWGPGGAGTDGSVGGDGVDAGLRGVEGAGWGARGFGAAG